MWVHFPACVYEGLCLCVALWALTLPTPVAGTLCLASLPGSASTGKWSQYLTARPCAEVVGQPMVQRVPASSEPLPSASSMPTLGPGGGSHGPLPIMLPVLYLRCSGSVPGLQGNASSKPSLPPRHGPLVSQGYLRRSRETDLLKRSFPEPLLSFYFFLLLL